MDGYLKCQACAAQVTILNTDLIAAVSTQIAGHDQSSNTLYVPSGEVVRLTNAINRGLEHLDTPEDVVTLILRGISVRYDCYPAPTKYENNDRLSEVDLKRFGQAVSHIVITSKHKITDQFKE